MLIDSHCHLNIIARKQDVDTIVRHAKSDYKLAGLLNVSVELEEAQTVIDQANRHDNVWASVGVHPCHQDAAQPTIENILQWTDHAKVIAVGEMGLDFFRVKEKDADWQYTRFYTQLEAAKQAQLPIIIHCRQAADQVMHVLETRDAAQCGGVMHCFVEDWECAKRALDLGFYISFSGIVTFSNAEALRDVARKVPIDRILVETDAPYLAPTPHRGKDNQPGYVRYVAECLAAARGLAVKDFIEQTGHNFFTCFPKAVV